MNLSEDQIEQGRMFLELISEDPDSINLHPIINNKTGEMRVGICITKEDEEYNTTYMLGLLLCGEDKLLKNLEIYEENNVVLERSTWWQHIVNFFRRKNAKD